MSVDDRIALMHEIWESLAAESDRVHLTDAQRRELERRLADHESDPTAVVAWEQVRTEALARFQGR